MMAAIWPDVIVEENNLDQNISMLRQLLGERRGERRYIVTVRRRGYRFVAPVRRLGPGDLPDSGRIASDGGAATKTPPDGAGRAGRPNYAPAHQWLGLYLSISGRFDEGLELMHYAQTLEPSSPLYGAINGLLLIYQRRYDEAIRTAREDARAGSVTGARRRFRP